MGKFRCGSRLVGRAPTHPGGGCRGHCGWERLIPQGRRPAPWPPCRARGSRRKSGSFPLTWMPPAPPRRASRTRPSTTGEASHPCPAPPKRRHGLGHLGVGLRLGVRQIRAGDAYEDHDLIFCDELGRPIVPNRLTEKFGDLRKRAKIRPGRLHDVRHSAATHLLSSGSRCISSLPGSGTTRRS